VAGLVGRLDLAGRRVCVLGISLGATVALELLRSRVLDVIGGVFIRPAHTTGVPAHLRPNEQIAALLREDPATALERLLASDAYHEVLAVSPSGAAGLREKVTKPGSAERVFRLEAGSRWAAFRPGERVEGPVPALVIGTPRDPLHPLEVAEAWQARIAGASLVVVPSRDDDPVAAAAATRSAVEGFLRPLVPPSRAGA
jgi:pimeloyl-ACP methyl ester carboxylesterase